MKTPSSRFSHPLLCLIGIFWGGMANARPPQTWNEMVASAAEVIIVGTIPDFTEKIKRVKKGDESMLTEITRHRDRFTSGLMEVEIEVTTVKRGFDKSPKKLKIGVPIWIARGDGRVLPHGGIAPHLEGSYEANCVFHLVSSEGKLRFECLGMTSLKDADRLDRFIERFDPERDLPRSPKK